MGIAYERDKKIFTLTTANSMYQMQVDRFGYLLHLYYGKKAVGRMDYLLTYADRGFSGNPYDAGIDRTYSMDALPQEFPTLGTGDYRTPACVIRNSDGTYACDFRYEGHRIYDGKYTLKGLPSVYEREEERQKQEVLEGEMEKEECKQKSKLEKVKTLEITLRDSASGVKAILLYGVLPEQDIITRSVIIRNDGAERITVEKLSSACLDFVTGDYDYLTFYGRHTMERNVQRIPVPHGIAKIGSFRGASSHQHNPAVILAERGATEDAGNCYALVFAYSGGFQSEAQKDQYDQTRVLMGLQEEMFSYPLAPASEVSRSMSLESRSVLAESRNTTAESHNTREENLNTSSECQAMQGECFIAPEVILSFSSRGLAALSQNLHRCMREHLCRGRYRDVRRPILINSWEASYFDFNGESLLALASEAAELGIELFVLDDGWFGNRCDDNRALGDWQVNEQKLGCTLGELIGRINALGMDFGIWIEPEMVNEDSGLYREHPDWVLAIPGRKPQRSRNQLVLDFSRKEVVNYIYEQICKVLDQGKVAYVKWDMNRSLADIYSAIAENQGKVMYDYVLGLYDFLERLITRYPDMLLEGCCGGGGRFDAGMLYYAPQIWCSDNTDPIERVSIQYGTSFIYPVSAVGAHVSASPNHQTGRRTPFKTRAAVAMAGAFGYELDLAKLSGEEKAEIRSQVAEYKKYADLIRQGNYYRLSDPASEEIGAWMFVSEDGSEAFVSVVSLAQHSNAPARYIRLKGLKEDAVYRKADSDVGDSNEEQGKTENSSEEHSNAECANAEHSNAECGNAENGSAACSDAEDGRAEECRTEYSGAALMYAGLPVPKSTEEYEAFTWYFRDTRKG